MNSYGKLTLILLSDFAIYYRFRKLERIKEVTLLFHVREELMKETDMKHATRDLYLQ